MKTVLGGGALFLLIAVTWICSPLPGLAQNSPKEEARQSKIEKYNHESNLRRRVKIAAELTDADLKQLVSVYKPDPPEQQAVAKATENYLAAMNLLTTAIREAKNAGASKDAEVHLGNQIRQLEQLKLNLSYFERPALDPVLERVNKAHEETIEQVMK